MNDILIESVLRGVLGGRMRKRSGKALRYLTGRKGSLLTHPATLLTAAGVAWGIYETLQAGQAAGAGVPPAGAVPPAAIGGDAVDDRTRMIRLAVSAANADGTLNEQERAAILAQAGADAAGVVARELELRRPLAEIVAGVTDQAQRATLYVLAYTILRADEQVNGAERIYLAQLANLLALDPATVQKLEKDAGERIDALGDRGQLGG